MKAPSWKAAVRRAAVPARAQNGFTELKVRCADGFVDALGPEHARILAALFSGSQAMSRWLLQHPECVQTILAPENLTYPRRAEGLRREVDKLLHAALPSGDRSAAFTELRRFKQRELLRIAARDLARLGDVAQITRELSDLADVTLDAALRLCHPQLVERLGSPWHLDAGGIWRPTQFSVIGLGKLGGQELNYSSDVDLIFVYSEEGYVFKEPPRRGAATGRAVSSHEFFKRLAGMFIGEVSRTTADGILHRVDLRLRPESEAGPVTRSLASYENYYAQWGQTWERMMLLKARGVAGDAPLAAEFLEMIQPFRHPRSLGAGVLREIAAMKARIESEVVGSGELERNVKLGRGGIREIEFVVQTGQLLNAGRAPFLQGGQTLPVLQKLAQYDLLSAREGRELSAAYRFLRDLEHRVQMENNLQTHVLPADHVARERFARLMGFVTPAAFERELKKHTGRVRAIYARRVQGGPSPPDSGMPRLVRGVEAEWKRLLAGHGFKDVEQSFRWLSEFANGPGFVHVSQRTTDLAMQLVPRFLALCRPTRAGTQVLRTRRGVAAPGRDGRPGLVMLSDPDRVLARLDSFITAYGTRAMLFETWTANPQLFELLLLLFDRSEFLAEAAIRTPDLVDDLVLSGRLGRSKTSEEILRDLRHGWEDADQKLWLRRYHQAEFMRIGLRGILGLADGEQGFLELSALAEACLQYALDVALREQRLASTPLAIIGLGKLGGRELNPGSDLDVLFVAEDRVKNDLPRLQNVAARVLDLLGRQTELGVAFATDARLRPDGEKGLLVNTLAAHRDYYQRRAQLWEIQAMTRARFVAGNKPLGGQFEQLVAAMTHFSTGGQAVPACFTPGWKDEIARMRARIEKERTPSGQDALAFKTGRGGLMDAEFIAQAMCLEHGWREPNTLCALQRVRGDRALPVADADKLLDNYRPLRRVESILRRWSFEGEAVLPADSAAFGRVAVRCGFEFPEPFREALARWRAAIREVYLKVFPA